MFDPFLNLAGLTVVPSVPKAFPREMRARDRSPAWIAGYDWRVSLCTNSGKAVGAGSTLP